MQATKTVRISALTAAQRTHRTPKALIDAYLNGPRTLHNERLSYLILSDTAGTALPTPPASPGPLDTSPNSVPNHDILICATHFLGDGMALHTFANDFFGLLGGGASEDELSRLVEDEWRAAVKRASDGVCRTITCSFMLKSHLHVIEIGPSCSDGG